MNDWIRQTGKTRKPKYLQEENGQFWHDWTSFSWSLKNLIKDKSTLSLVIIFKIPRTLSLDYVLTLEVRKLILLTLGT